MNNTALVDLAELSLAAYGQFDVANRSPIPAQLTNLNGDEHGFALSQATRFGDRFLVALPTFSDATAPGGSGGTSFDVTVFRRVSIRGDGQVFIAFRGTAQKSPIETPNDLSALLEFAAVGAAPSQIVAMYNWWQRVSTPKSATVPTLVPQYRYTFIGNQLERIADAPSTGEIAVLLASTPGAKVSVTGSSLGGHLAMAFAGLFPAVVEQAVAFNSPGFADNAAMRSLFATLGGTLPLVNGSLITNVVSSEANNAGDQLDLLAGFPGGNFPGTKLTIPIENQFGSDVLEPKIPSWNHDQRQITDALAVFGMLERLDPSMTLARFERLLRVSANGENRSLENLVGMVESALGVNTGPLPAGNAPGARDALHRAVQALVGGAPQSPEPDVIFQSLAGNVRLGFAGTGLSGAAKTNFQSLVALQMLSPFVLEPAGSAGAAALNSLWRTPAWAVQYEDWMSDQIARQSGGVALGYSDAYLADRQALLNQVMSANLQYAQANPDGYLPVSGSGGGNVNTRYVDGISGQLLQVNDVRISPSTAPNRYVVFGSATADVFGGASEDDHLYGGAGNDTLTGHAGNDYLEGGSGDDRYVFSGNFGVDRLSDTDASGGIELDGQMLTGGGGSGTANLWLGADDAGRVTRYVVRDSKDSATGKQLLIARAGDPGNTVTVNHFDLAAASSAAGYLGIRLDNAQRLVIAQGTKTDGVGGNSPFEAWNFDPNTFTGQTTMAQGGASLYTMFLRVAAKAGDTITLALSGLQDKFQALIGRRLVGASGAVIALEEGQTQVSFGLLQEGQVGAFASAGLSASYFGANAALESNTWSVQLQDAGSAGQTLAGDQTYLVRTSATTIVRDGRVVVQAGGMAYAVDAAGNLVAGAGVAIGDNVLYGADGADQLRGLLGNDALDGGAGNDLVLGGDGDDLIAGGSGNNDLQGGAGNDFILGAGTLSLNLQQLGPGDTWQVPAGKPLLGRGSTWGVYAQSDGLLVWDGAVAAAGGQDASTIEAGDGDDHVIAGAGDDRIDGEAGNDHLDGMGGSDFIFGGLGNDTIRADGIVLAGYFNTSIASSHGADYVDAGEGDDEVQGGGDADVLLGGAGADRIFGDSGGRTDGEFHVPLQYHGADQIDGEEGDDYLEGGGRGDTLYGGSGADTLWGDTTADNVVGDAGGPGSTASAYGDDHLDGEDGNDKLAGGGGDDALFGGAGDDTLWGDESNAALAGDLQGADYLDGELGDDVLVGGGRNDSLLGGDGNDQLAGDDVLAVLGGAFHGDDYLDGGAGNDTLVGGGGSDVLFGGAGTDVLRGDLDGADGLVSAFDGKDHLDGEEGDDRLFGGGGDDFLKGGTGNDQLDGGSGADAMEGGSGDDSYVVDDAGDLVVEAYAAGTDSVTSWISITLPDNVENLTLTGVGGVGGLDATGNEVGNALVGTSGANRIFGLGGNDTLVGGGGADLLVGGLGDDTFEVDDPGDVVVEAAGEGTDTVRSQIDFALPEHVERLLAVGAGHLQLTGNALDNDLFGNAGNNLLNAAAGNDYLSGGGGNDVYIFNPGSGQDTIGNTDLLRDTANAALPGGFDVLRFGAGINAADVVGSRVGDDVLLQLRGSTDSVTLAGYFGANMVTGSRVSDHKIDQVAFASGLVWRQATIESVVARAAANHRPTAALVVPALQARVGQSFTYTIAANTIVDQDTWDSVRYSLRSADGSDLPAWLSFDTATRTLAGTPTASQVGSAQLVLWGTDMYGLSAGAGVGINITDPLILGTAGNDTLTGSAQNDTVRGLGGNDLIRGGGGSDVLDGGDGDDQLFADSGSSSNELLGGAGNDTLSADRLAAGNRFEGGTGNDTLRGSAYDDTYHFALGDGRDNITEIAPVDGAGDRLVFGAGIAPADISATRLGNDMVFSHRNGTDQVTVKAWFTKSDNWIERVQFADNSSWNAAALTAVALVVNGTTGDDVMVGSAMNDTLRGLAGNDNLSGGAGSDILDGGEGYDVMVVGADGYESSNNQLFGGDGNDRMSATRNATDNYFEGGKGGDSAIGGGYRDTYRFNLGDEQDWITETEVSTLTGGNDVLEFGPGIAPGDIRVWRNNNDLYFSHANGTDKVTVGDWFASTATFSATARRVETVRFADGTVWNAPALTAAALVVRGTPTSDSLSSSDMDDTLYGFGGSDWLSGGRGHNILDGGDGDDLLYADDGYYNVFTYPATLRDYWGSNELIGGAGNDTFWTAALARDTVFDGGPGNDILRGSAYNDIYRFKLGDGRDTITEAAPAAGYVDKLSFGPGILPADMRVSRLGDDLVLAHANGLDQVTVTGWFPGPNLRIESITFADGVVWNDAAVNAALSTEWSGTAGADTLVGSAGPDNITGLGGNDVLSGLAGADWLQGGTGNDKLDGGEGNDVLFGDAPGESANSELVTSLVVFARGSICENVWPTMEVWLAGARVQSFSVASTVFTAYTVTVPAGTNAASVDLVFTNDAYRSDLGQDRNLYVERIEVNGRSLGASGAGAVLDFGSGAAAFDGFNTTVAYGAITSHAAVRIGLGGNDQLDGGAGADTMAGGVGNDLYLVDNSADVVTEAANAGHDIVRSTASYTLGDNLEDLELTGAMAINATGNATANTLRGNAAANRIDGGAGRDMLVGGAGDDTYVVDKAGDYVYEISGGGSDTVESAVSFTLGNEVEKLQLTGTAAINGTGNSLNNLLTGNAASNTLSGGAGDDTLNAGAGNDTLLGGAGNDVLFGDAPGESANSELVTSLVVFARGSICENVWPTMEVWLAGARVQSFSVASAVFTAYTVTVPAGTNAASVDLVFTNDAYRSDLGQDRNLYVERIEVNGRSLSASGAGAVLDFGSGAAAFDGFNTTVAYGAITSHAAVRIGLGGNDQLDGGAGADTMAGGVGNDLYLVDNSADVVTEAANAGHDIVRSTASYALGDKLEDLELIGTLAINATGNAGANTLRGNSAANRLDGGAGGDMLVGGAGDDSYFLARGSGADIAYEYDFTPGNTDLALFDAGTNIDQLWFRRVSNSLEVSVIGTADRLTVSGWYSGDQYHLEQFKTSGGRTLLDSQVNNLVNAMAAFAPPAMGQTSLSAALAEQLSPVLAANWH